jgi:hypothetical protein
MPQNIQAYADDTNKGKRARGFCQVIRHITQYTIEGPNVKAHLSDPYNEVILALTTLNMAVMKHCAI